MADTRTKGVTIAALIFRRSWSRRRKSRVRRSEESEICGYALAGHPFALSRRGLSAQGEFRVNKSGPMALASIFARGLRRPPNAPEGSAASGKALGEKGARRLQLSHTDYTFCAKCIWQAKN